MSAKMKILIGYDGVHPIENFVQDLKQAGLPKAADALVMTVVDVYLPQSADYSELSLPASTVSYIENIREEAEARAKKGVEHAKKMAAKAAKAVHSGFPGWKVQSLGCMDAPVWGIIKKSDAWKPDLTVVGSHGASAVARFFLGSVSRSVLIHSRGSVRIVRKNKKSGKSPARIVIGIDGSYDSQKAVKAVAGRSWPKGSSVRLVTAFDQNISMLMAFRHLSPAKKDEAQKDTEKNWMRRMTEPFVERLRYARLDVTCTVKAGTPWKVLVSEAEKWKADCIFIGARGLNPVSRLLLGSVSNAVASRAHCSVEVVR